MRNVTVRIGKREDVSKATHSKCVMNQYVFGKRKDVSYVTHSESIGKRTTSAGKNDPICNAPPHFIMVCYVGYPEIMSFTCVMSNQFFH